jgi:uncharacterized membrane protein YciS (DUF1049 family)
MSNYQDNKKDVIIHIFDLFIIVGSVVAAVFYLHAQIDRIDQRVEKRISCQERRLDEIIILHK